MSSAPEIWTVLRLLQWTTDYLKKQEIASPRLEAEILLAEAMKCSRVELYTRFDYEPTADERAVFKGHIQKRAQGMPVAYLVGHKEFYSLDFLVDPNVLIPRPETEFLILGLFDLVKEHYGGMAASVSILDVGTGSGILPVTAGFHLKNAEILAVDISAEALSTAQKNVEKYAKQLGNRVTLQQSDLFSTLPEGKTFDFILSNPPYVGRKEINAELEKNVYRYEPHTALFGGENGTELIERMLPEIPRRLNPNGWFLMELSPMIHDGIVDSMQKTPGLKYVKTLKDLDQQQRIVVGIKN
ncbi:MAG: peptide chain release factor N(5)-glutamine methyltransferase [Planctomycetaceae bacterium]|nr:peptide chain release factor N(5)-glutamine methyltransferase [Planctomycetaceae bacterium]MBQ2822365.1 peptide chain release factor N(5)-glutamine methyltransferase [Thermoguttaceae bacterium]